MTSSAQSESTQSPSTPYHNLYEEVELIARSCDRQTYLILSKQSPDEYLVARKTNIYSLDESVQDQILNECTVLKTLSHPHIVKYHNVMLEGEHLIVILEYCEEGDLAHYLRKRIARKDYLSERLILNWLLQILMALDHLHSNKIIHRGIELGNMFLNSRGDIKLGSFGHSKVHLRTNAKASTMVGRLGYMSPQMFEEKPYDSKSDMWALGCLVYQLATFTPLFDDRLAVTSLYEKIVKDPVPDLPVAYMKTLFPIYKKLLKKNPAHRPQAADLLKTPLFLSVMNEYLSKKRIDLLQLKDIPLKKLAAHERTLQMRRKEKGVVLPPLRKSGQTFALTSSNLRGSNEFQMSESGKSVQSEPPSKPTKKSRSKDRKEHIQQGIRSPRVEKQCTSNLPPISSLQHKQKVFSRLTNLNEQEQYKHIEELYKAQIGLICKELEKRYGPKMQLILERTLDFDPEDN